MSSTQTRQSLGQCPRCGGNIIEGKRGYGCSNWKEQDGGCNFVIWKVTFGKLIMPQIISRLLAEKEVGPMKGFFSEDEKQFTGIMKLVNENNDWKVRVEPSDGEPIAEHSRLGECPACGGNILESGKAYGCENWKDANGGCKFVIWKNIAGKEITPQIVEELLAQRKTGPIEGFISKKGEPFSANLKLVQDNGIWKVQFDFPNISDEPIGKCPACGGDIIETKKAYGCRNWREADGGCKFTIWKTIAHKELSKETAIQLLETGTAGPLFGFMSRNGNAFAARLKLSQNEGQFKVIFDFSDSPSPSNTERNKE